MLLVRCPTPTPTSQVNFAAVLIDAVWFLPCRRWHIPGDIHGLLAPTAHLSDTGSVHSSLGGSTTAGEHVDSDDGIKRRFASRDSLTQDGGVDVDTVDQVNLRIGQSDLNLHAAYNAGGQEVDGQQWQREQDVEEEIENDQENEKRRV